MTKESALKLFDGKKIRTRWDADQEKWYFSIIDVIEVLTGTERPRKYWNDLKSKLKKEGSDLSENIGQLKLNSIDGKYYKASLVRNVHIDDSGKDWGKVGKWYQFPSINAHGFIYFPNLIKDNIEKQDISPLELINQGE